MNIKSTMSVKSDIWALWRSVLSETERQSARMSEIKNGMLGLYAKV